MRGPDKLAAWRTEQGLSQAAAAERLGMSQFAWSAYETGRQIPGLEAFGRLMALLKDSPHALSVDDWKSLATHRGEERKATTKRRTRARKRAA